ncbi:MAG TPA: WD40 repeat domain-containing protein, partial [Chloroflexota bacterium]|nr:WD40 repeat domain-containing protein [Chloroflexota bacterium]
GGNPLALKIVGEAIGEVMGGDIAPFLEYAQETYGAVFGGIRRLLDGQVERLSALERALFYWLAVEREPVGLAGLVADLGPGVARGEALGRRSLLERGEHGVTITVQPVVLEYATDRLVEALTREIAEGRPALLRSHALLKATAKDYVRRSQEWLIAAPLLEHMAGACGAAEEVDRRLLDLLDGWRGRPSGGYPRSGSGYGPGNTVNLLRQLRGHLRGVDLSRLSIRQAYLQEVEAQDARLVGAHLVQAVLAEAFDDSVCVALSADGAYLAAGTSNGEVRLWRVVDRAPLLAVQGHTGGVYGVALSADGRLVASSGLDGTVQLWETGDGRLLTTLRGHTDMVWGVALSADGRLAASGSYDETVRLWEAASGRLLATLRGHNGAVFCVALAADG